jgi:predicted amidophosphoribosyltransferase
LYLALPPPDVHTTGGFCPQCGMKKIAVDKFCAQCGRAN